jgi:FtsP/CotA-like multicopper oxidase with cupredoxin domain
MPATFTSFAVAPMTRRRCLAGLGASLTAITLPGRSFAEERAADGFRVLRTRSGKASLRGKEEAPTAIWGYDGTVPGPALRLKQGDELKVRVVNELKQSTVVHWHGLRLPNAMDGVPHLTQMPIEPGASFDYRFTAPDAGTFWYHSHFLSSEQVERGLYGVLIVEEREPIAVDRDVILMVDDWRLADDGAIHPSFGNFHDAMMAGRLGQYITLNSEDTLDVPVKTNERVRLRIINSANARIFQLRIARHAARVMAVDGQPCPPNFLSNGVLRLGPGNRVDLFLDATLSPGSQTPILVDDLRGGELEVGRLVYSSDAPLRPSPLPEPAALPDNPLPSRMDFAHALRLDVPLDGGGMAMMMGRGGMMGGGMGGAGFRGYGIAQQERIWALASVSSTGHDGPPLFSVARGRTVVLTFPNRTAFPHAMHVHGHHFRQLESGEAWGPYWFDTVIVDPQRTERIAFVADNPGKWMVHCHMLEHQEAGMAAWFEVT